MSELLNYNLTQFIMVSPEVFQDLHQRYSSMLWPWLSIFILGNSLVLFKKYRHFLWVYVAVSWLFIAFIYFTNYFSQVHNFAWLATLLFVLQAGLILMFKMTMSGFACAEKGGLIYPLAHRLGLIVYGVSAFIPFSLVLENSKGALLLFGWGAEQTALGTIGLIVYLCNTKRELLLLLIPSLWLIFYILFL